MLCDNVLLDLCMQQAYNTSPMTSINLCWWWGQNSCNCFVTFYRLELSMPTSKLYHTKTRAA